MNPIAFISSPLPKSLLGQAPIGEFDPFDPVELTLNLPYLSQNQLYRLLTTPDQKGETLLDENIQKILRGGVDSNDSFECLIILIKHLSPKLKATLFLPNGSLWLLYCSRAVDPKVCNKAERLLAVLEDLDIEIRKEIAIAQNSEGKTIVHIAVCNQNDQLISSLCKGFTSQDRVKIFRVADYKKRTPFHMAYNSPPNVWSALLQDLTAKQIENLVAIKEKKGLPVLHYIKKHGHSNMSNVNILIAASPRVINLQDSKGKTLLHYVSKIADLQSVKYFLLKGANPTIVNNHGKCALSEDAIKDWKEVQARWANFRITYADDEIEEIHPKLWDETKKLAILLFPKFDHNRSFSFTWQYGNVVHLTHLDRQFNVLLYRIDCIEKATNILKKINRPIDLLGIAGHMNPTDPSYLLFGNKELRDGMTAYLSNDSESFMRTVGGKMVKQGGVMALYGCMSGVTQEEEETDILAQELSKYFEGIVVASSDYTTPSGIQVCDSPQILRFTRPNGSDCTVLFKKALVFDAPEEKDDPESSSPLLVEEQP